MLLPWQSQDCFSEKLIKSSTLVIYLFLMSFKNKMYFNLPVFSLPRQPQDCFSEMENVGLVLQHRRLALAEGRLRPPRPNDRVILVQQPQADQEHSDLKKKFICSHLFNKKFLKTYSFFYFYFESFATVFRQHCQKMTNQQACFLFRNFSRNH